MKKYLNKYRIPSTRLQKWDYRWNAAYFITVCTQQREHYFGEIENGEMQLSQIGIIANVMWYEIKNHSKNVKLGAFIVMPDHIHGILILDGNKTNDDGCDDIETTHASGCDKIETTHALSLLNHQNQNQQSEKTIGQKRFQHQGKNSVSSVIGSYKSAVSKHAHRLGFSFGWQSRFHDHIIRNADEYNRINNYIKFNSKSQDHS